MRPDQSEVVLTTAFHQHKQLWASQFQIGNGSPTKIAGRGYRSEEHPLRRDGLITTAIISALGSIPRKLQVTMQEMAERNGLIKPRVLIRAHSEYAAAFEAKDLHVGKKVFQTLTKAFRPYDVSFFHVEDVLNDGTMHALSLFAERSLDGRYYEERASMKLPRMYRPDAISIRHYESNRAVPLTPDLVSHEEQHA